MGEAIVFTSGKGGVGKTTTIANIGTGLAQLDKKVVMLDTDMGLRNLDVVMGLEDRINYNLLDVLENRCRLNQALIKDKRFENLYMIPASLKVKPMGDYEEAFKTLINHLKKEFDFCLIDCPAGMDGGFHFAVSAVDRAVVVTTPHISAVRDAGRILYLLENKHISKIDLIINEYDEKMVRKNELLSKEDIEELLGMHALGIVPRDQKIIISQNQGIPVVSMKAKSSKFFLELSQKMNRVEIVPIDLSENSNSSEILRFFRRKGAKVDEA